MMKLKRLVLCAMIPAIMLLLSGCLRMHIDIVWNDDNSATMDMTIAMESSAASMMGDPEDMRDQTAESMLDESIDFVVKDYDEDGYIGIVASAKIDNVTANSSDTLDTLKFSYSEAGKTKTYTLSGDFEGAGAMGDMGDMEDMGLSTDDLEYDMKMSVVMPGTIISHNATEKQGNKLIWDLAGADIVKISAVSEVSSSAGFLTILLWVLFVLFLLIFAAAVFVLVMQQQKKKKGY